MRSSRFILCYPYVAAVLAKDPVAHLVDYGAAKSQDLLGVCESPLCSNEHPVAILEDPIAEDRAQAAALWPHATPCARNGTKEFCVYSDPEFAGRGIGILTSPERAIEIAKSKVFNDPEVSEAIDELNAEESPRWMVAEVPGKGMGLIATQNLEMGDHIMSTSASVMIDYSVFYEVTEAQLLEMQAAAVENLPKRHRTAFLNLSTHDHAENYQTQVSKVILTNAFDIQDTGLVTKKNDDEEENFYTVFPEISRMNHDCRPNADYQFDPETYTQHVHAVRRIAAGEEITISYIDPIQTQKDRLNRLNNSWHFPCSCSACTQNKHFTAASDARIQQILELRKQLRNWDPYSQATPSMAELLVSLYEEERLWSNLYEAYTYAAIEYNGAGDPWMATKYARLAIHHGLAVGGPKDSDVIEMTSLAKDPWEHWSWMLRTKKRMNWGAKVDE
ncbi:hypothetical protein JX265_002373 [Neoarthrinium moseri]|uniref:SET domain-containing protein n=1 Tax=Neoarthrinium moseri TaxID=1658444 RepID=A0A9Q0ASY7_9PEZI|nr:uncharacterized protein JN550_000187 [Neoarthrinium moseri]KAI1854736.1 hypothetical protein JX266_000854 [Neoarthrinium moseri]KAI1878005.1 hypothetical protein JN550_000187 [Neoarthrinium moseri]KAI1879419.1 hypothetical protein JX265_002373 [Neoarthrinium moseri]